MATPAQRARTIINALMDGDASPELMRKIADAYVFTYRRGETLTANQKSLLFIQETRRHIRRVVKDAIEAEAVATAREQADSTIAIGADELPEQTP